MSCPTCATTPLRGAFARWKHTNVEIIGCREHVREVLEALRDAQEPPARFAL